MSLEIRFKQDPTSFPQYLSLQDGESLQVFSGECFQIQNPQVVAQLVPQANDLQIVCHDGSSYILKSFLDVQFSKEPMLELKEGTSITWHDFVQQSDGVELADIADDQYSQSILFAPLHVIAMTSESQKWDLSHSPPETDERAIDSGIASIEPSQSSPISREELQENSATTTSSKLGNSISETETVEPAPEGALPHETDSGNARPLDYTTSTILSEIEIDIRDFIPSNNENRSTEDPTITAKLDGGDPTEYIIDPGTGILRLPDNIFDDDHQKKFIISIRDNGTETGTAITITQTKDGGGEVFHLILSHNRVTENNEGALIGKLDTDDSGQGHTYEYSILHDESGVFEISGNVLKLKDGVSIDYEAQPDRYPITIVSTNENGNRVEQTLSIWPEDVNEAASVASVGAASLEDVTITFNPEDFENSFEDEDSDYLEMIRVDSLPDNGVLLLEGERVANGQLIDIDQVEDLQFHPDVNWNGETEFTWSGFDGQRWSGDSSTVNITIEAVNDTPIVNVNVGSETTATEALFELSLPKDAFTDPDVGDKLTYSGDLPSWLEIEPETGSLKGTPSSESVGEHTITITATDSAGESVSQSFQLVVDPANRAPSITQIESQTTNEDSLFSLDVSGNFSDLDGDTLTFSAVLENGDPFPDWLSFNSETGTFSGTPRNDDVGTIELRVTASDRSESISNSFSIDVANTNDGPVVTANIDNQIAQEDDSFVLDASEHFGDADFGDSLTYSATLQNGESLPNWISVDSETGHISGTPRNADVGELDIAVSASDGKSSVSQSFSLSVDNTNDTPTLTANFSDQTISEDSAFSLDASAHFADEDLGDTLTYSATLENGDPLPEWLTVNETTGELSGTPKNGDVGDISVTIKVSDGEASASDTIIVSVENTNDGPVASISIQDSSVSEDAAFNIELASNFTDEDVGDTLHYSATLENGEPLPDWLTFDSETGSLSGTPGNSDVGDLSITVTASDGEEQTSQSFSLSVENANDAPILNAIIPDNSVLEDSEFSLDISSHFEDSDLGDSLSYTANLEGGGELPAWLNFEENTGQFSGIPENGDVGDLNITVIASDGEASVSDTFIVSVENTNDGPVASSSIGEQTTNEDSQFNLNVSENFTDEDLGDSLTFSATLENGDPLPEWMSFDSETGQISGTPTNDAVGDLELVVTASDGEAQTSQGFTLTIENTNDAPVLTANIDDESVSEDAGFTLDVSSNFSDSDLGDELVFEATLENGDPLPDWLSFDENTGQFSGQPTNTDVGEISITVVASDGEEIVSDTFSVTVDNTNDGPTVSTSISDQTTAEGAVFSLDISGNFADEDLGDTLTFSATLENGDPLPDWISIDEETGEISGTPDNGDVGDLSITVTASDGQASASDTFSISVENTNDGPTVSTSISDQTTDEDAAFSLDFSGNFADEDLGDTLTYSATLENGDPLPDWLSIDESTGELSGTPENGDAGNISVTVTASDGEAFASDTFSISVENTNDGPAVTSAIVDQTTDEDSAFSLDVSSNFADQDLGDTLTYSATLENGEPLPDWLSIDEDTGELSGTPENGDVGNISVTVTASDGEASASDTFSISVENTNDGPTVTSAIVDQTTDEDAAFFLDVSGNFSDADLGDTLTYSATLENGDPLPDWLSIDEDTGELSGTPENGDVGDISVTVTASDGEATASDTFYVTVENTNDGPTVSTSISDQATDEDAAFSLDVSGNFSDADLGDTLTFSATLENGDPLPDWLSIDADTGELSGTPENGDVGDLSVTVTASDGQESASDTFSVTVESTNDAPIVSSSISDQTTDEDAAFSLDVSGNFSDEDLGDSLTYSVELTNESGETIGDGSLPTWLSFDPATGQFSGTPENGDVGSFCVQVTASDGSESASDIVAITVDNTNDGPTVSTSISDQATDEDAAFSLDVSGNFADEDLGDTLTYSATLEGGDPLPDWISIDADTGELSGTPENGDVGDLSITVTATDESGETASDTFSVTVENTNDGPTVSTSIADQTTDEDSAFSLDVSGNFSDEDLGDTLAYSATLENGDPLPSWLSIDTSTGMVSGTPDSGDVGEISISITASDGESSVSDVFDLDVTAFIPDPDENITGTNGADIITTGSGNDTIDGGNSNDTISSGKGDDTIYATRGKDTVDAGEGEDTIIIDDDKNFGSLDGGDGFDIIRLEGDDIHLDFSNPNANLHNIEKIDLSGGENNSIRLSVEDVLDVTDDNKTLFIEGDDQSVEISEDFVSQGTENVDGVDYTHFYDAGADAHIYVNNEITDLGTF